MKFKYSWQFEDVIKDFDYNDATGKYYKIVKNIEIQIDIWNKKIHLMSAYNQFIEFDIDELVILKSLLCNDFEYENDVPEVK